MNSTSAYHYSAEMIAEESLQIAAARKDPTAFAPLYRTYHERIFLFILKRIESEETAADITSSVFLKAMSKLHSYKDLGLPFGSWLFRIARNELYDQYAKNKVDLVLSVDTPSLGNVMKELQTEQKADHSDLYNALHRLKNEEMELIEMRFFEDRPFREIGEILEITENNAKVRTYRALDKLKTFLQNER
jgi:RNA polymerase sigma-70 factor (ECF subfamily)